MAPYFAIGVYVLFALLIGAFLLYDYEMEARRSKQKK